MEDQQNNLLKGSEQKHKFEQLYKQQEIERQAQKELKKQLDEQNKDPKEKMLTIQKEFKGKQEELSLKIKNFKKDALDIDQLFIEYRSLKEYFIGTNHALTTFDKQQYKDQLDKLEKHLFILRDMVKPRKKFRFSKRIKDEEYYKNKENQQQRQIIADANKPEIQSEDYFNQIPGLQNLQDQTLNLSKDEIKSSFKLYNLKNCTIQINHLMDNIYVKNLDNCQIFVGPVKSSVFVEQCKNCTLHLMGHQLRIHNSTETRFNIFSSSKSIIEHCTKLEFAPYTHQYEGFEQHKMESGFQDRENLWRDIQDFNWLKQEKSPNFTLIE